MAAEAGRKLTLADIAELAGVSRSAAGRALDAVAPVGGPRADRVRAIAAEHGYVPNSWAANLRKQRTGLIGVVVPRLTDTVMAMLYEAIVDGASERGYQAVVVTAGDDPLKQLQRGRALVKQRVDGFILTTARTDGADPFLLELKEKGIPHALALRTDGHSPAARIDDRLGGELATRHLLEHGHRRIAFIGGPAHASSSQGREAGFREAMEAYEMPIRPGTVHHSDFSVDAGMEIADRLFALAEVPTAVFTANDSLALGVMSAAQRAAIRVPEDLSIIGFNDTPLAQHLAVPLTSMRVSFETVAANALTLLLEPEGDAAAVSPVTPVLVERSSVATL
ncbi:LacI family transcriptional regulator [Microbacterium sp. HD4P20]|uniref:LacI family DNA-binding transcriptional regulator n=1 Tax=Microbacterium sp. HD4P20 TaxID=2864874 RepID=UPI001C643DFA|nr:LacI family DNA-binding transcriptional regulator [Microbacterium sp. HD4P20]MCP2636142.1 LacI family transcriptional regulator [Microbacterium sp. HD4P20]